MHHFIFFFVFIILFSYFRRLKISAYFIFLIRKLFEFAHNGHQLFVFSLKTFTYDFQNLFIRKNSLLRFCINICHVFITFVQFSTKTKQFSVLRLFFLLTSFISNPFLSQIDQSRYFSGFLNFLATCVS